VTTVNPANPTLEQFFSGAALAVTRSLANGGKASVSFNLSSNLPGLSIDWKFGEAAYNTWPLDWNTAMISPTNGTESAGSPLNTQIQQALNAGGSDFSGKQSSTGHASCVTK
jgi:hypothetical protein